ncbi:MAG: HDOD domain-containing protein [Oleibacter sp.]|nr:HDOD domain-containing protein [Thalassolituus sp.]
MKDLILQVKDDILGQIKRDEMVLPTLPEIALKIREVAEDENTDVDHLAKVISSDPAISTRLLKVANSPLFRASESVTDLERAISRLGINKTANMVVGLAMQQMFQATNEHTDFLMRQCWSRSTDIASTSAVLARHFTKIHPEQAMLAGLMHQVGVLPLITYAENNDHLLQSRMVLSAVIEKLHPALGGFVMRAWGFSDDLVRVPREYLKFDRAPEQTDLTDIVQVATLQYHAGTEHRLGKIDRSKVDAYKRLGLNIEDSADLARLDELAEDTHNAQQALQ